MKYIKIFSKIINMYWYFGKSQTIIYKNKYPVSSGNKTSYLSELFNVDIIKRKGAILLRRTQRIINLNCVIFAPWRLCV